MNKSKQVIIATTALILLTLFGLRNQLRLVLFKKQEIRSTKVRLYRKIDEQGFRVEVYDLSRNYSNRWATWIDRMFTDRILVACFPLAQFHMNSLVMQPIGNDKKRSDASFRFNTLFFNQEFLPTRGLIDARKLIGHQIPGSGSLGIDASGQLSTVGPHGRETFPDVMKPHWELSTSSKAVTAFDAINYRQFMAIDKGELVFVSVRGNSLISWKDVRDLLAGRGITRVYVLDGGASLDYFIRGKDTYSFSAIPFRESWFWKKWNSPYYLEGIARK